MIHATFKPFVALGAISVRCDACGYDTPPDFFKVTRWPVVPIKPDVLGPDEPGRWVLKSLDIKCQRCAQMLQLEIPNSTKRPLGRACLYGDDAAREHNGRRLATYSIVGASPVPLSAVNAAVRQLKTDLEPGREPSEWSFHMKVLVPGNQRNKHPVYRNWDRNKVAKAIDSLFHIVASTENLLKYNVFATATGPGDTAKHDAFLALILKVIEDVAAQDGRTELFFDSEKPIKGQTTVHAWAQKLFLDSQYCALYAFLARGIEIPEPRFVKPASEPCLERRTG